LPIKGEDLLNYGSLCTLADWMKKDQQSTS